MKKAPLLIVLLLSFVFAGCPPEEDETCELERKEIIKEYNKNLEDEDLTSEQKEYYKKERDRKLSDMKC